MAVTTWKKYSVLFILPNEGNASISSIRYLSSYRGTSKSADKVSNLVYYMDISLLMNILILDNDYITSLTKFLFIENSSEISSN